MSTTAVPTLGEFLRGASFTLTSGIFADQTWPRTTGGGVISGALHSFVLSAAVELPRGMRVNASNSRDAQLCWRDT